MTAAALRCETGTVVALRFQHRNHRLMQIRCQVVVFEKRLEGVLVVGANQFAFFDAQELACELRRMPWLARTTPVPVVVQSRSADTLVIASPQSGSSSRNTE